MRYVQTKRCPCGKQFSTDNPRHTQCRQCHRSKLRAEAAVRERQKQRESLRESLREAFLSGALPKSAATHRVGSQVVVVWMGRSHTFHLAA